MEGVLLKWTNYWNGWQTRWFVLQDGILSYYSSSEEVNQGCKGSMKVSALEIAVSSTDSTRMDLSIPGEKNIYLKAPSPQERQLWLVALGSSKACLTDQEGAVLNGLPVDSKDDLYLKRAKLRTYCDLLMQQVHDLKTTVKREIPDSETRLQKIEEESALISATCDSFIRTLEECMEVTKDPSSFPNKLPRSDRYTQKANNISRPTVPVMRTNSSEKKA